MIDEDEGEQNAAAGEIRPMLSISRCSPGRFPAAHEIARRRIAWFKDEVAALQLGIKKGA